MMPSWKCCQCGRTWEGSVTNDAHCICGSRLVRWENFEQWRRSPERSSYYRRVSGVDYA